MRSTANSTDLCHLQEVQGTTGGEHLSPDDLLALRAFFLLLDDWDRGSHVVDEGSVQTRIISISQQVCPAHHQGNAVPSPQRQGRLCETR